MMSCHEATRLISESQDRPLTRTERIRLSMHTLMCRGCHRFEQQMDTLRGLARSFAGHPGPDDDSQSRDERH